MRFFRQEHVPEKTMAGDTASSDLRSEGGGIEDPV